MAVTTATSFIYQRYFCDARMTVIQPDFIIKLTLEAFCSAKPMTFWRMSGFRNGSETYLDVPERVAPNELIILHRRR
jgi:hypothetical protein